MIRKNTILRRGSHRRWYQTSCGGLRVNVIHFQNHATNPFARLRLSLHIYFHFMLSCRYPGRFCAPFSSTFKSRRLIKKRKKENRVTPKAMLDTFGIRVAHPRITDKTIIEKFQFCCNVMKRQFSRSFFVSASVVRTRAERDYWWPHMTRIDSNCLILSHHLFNFCHHPKIVFYYLKVTFSNDILIQTNVHYILSIFLRVQNEGERKIKEYINMRRTECSMFIQKKWDGQVCNRGPAFEIVWSENGIYGIKTRCALNFCGYVPFCIIK